MTKAKKETVNPKKPNNKVSVQRYMEFSGVHDDTLVLRNGGIRAVLEVGSVNFNLKSEEEQNAIIYGYQRFLNSLQFSVQILMRSRKYDVDDYLDKLRMKKGTMENPLLQNQMSEYIEYVGRLVEYADIMEKRFFVVVPENPFRAEKVSMWASFKQKIMPDDDLLNVIRRKKEFRDLKKTLDERVNTVKTGLENCGLSVNQLSTDKIIELFYQCYNPSRARAQKFHRPEDLAMMNNIEDNIEVVD